jgi:hypothetical protein
MDWSTLFGGLGQQSGIQPGQPTSAAPGAPMNILPPVAQTPPTAPMGILNGQPAPQAQGQGNQSLIQQAQKMMQPQQAPPPMQPIQMARPLGSQGIDPMKLLAAMKQNNLMNAS